MFNIDWSKPLLLNIKDGPPDLAVNVAAAKSSILAAFPSGMRDSTVVTITVHNQLTLIPPSLPISGAVEAYGSDAKGVVVLIQLTHHIQQVGGILVPAGFIAVVAASAQTIYCIGGTIPAGQSVNFQMEVIWKENTEVSCWDGGTISAEVDPLSSITEVSKSNNKASMTIGVFVGVC